MGCAHDSMQNPEDFDSFVNVAVSVMPDSHMGAWCS